VYLFSELKVSAVQEYPCESSHELTLQIGEVSLSVQVPWPFHTDDIKSTVQDKTSSRLVKLILEKSINDQFPKGIWW